MNLRLTLLFFILTVFIFGCTSPSSENTYTINVQADGVYDGIRGYLKRNENGKTTTSTDTAIAQKGRFLFKGIVKATEMHTLTIDGIYGQVFFVLEPGETTITVYKDSIQKSKVVGGYNNDVFTTYKAGYLAIADEVNALRKEFSLVSDNPDKVKELQQRNSDLRQEMKNFGFTFLKQYPNSDFSLILLEGMTTQPSFDVNAAEEILELIDKDIMKKSYNAETFFKIRRKIDEAKAKGTIAVGALAPDFTAPNPEGEPIAMSAIKGKITIIDFWASWCRPCRVENPTYVRLYEQYHSKGLEIISVSLDRENQKQLWIDAIAKDKLTWYNVSHLKFWKDPVAQLYNITSIPAAFIIDEKGTIVAERLRGAALEAKIAELLD